MFIPRGIATICVIWKTSVDFKNSKSLDFRKSKKKEQFLVLQL